MNHFFIRLVLFVLIISAPLVGKTESLNLLEPTEGVEEGAEEGAEETSSDSEESADRPEAIEANGTETGNPDGSNADGSGGCSLHPQ